MLIFCSLIYFADDTEMPVNLLRTEVDAELH